MEINHENREKSIVYTSLIGIITNLFLATFKAIVGLSVNSIAIVLDALNNFSDVLSSVITIIGTKLANKKADQEHPYGHGRYEFLAPIIIALLILYAGMSAFIESIKKLFDPVEPTYGILSIALMVLAVITKVVLGQYVKKKGQQLQSNSLIASGEDALFDAILTASVLTCIGFKLLFNIQLEAFVSLVISIFILKAGYELIADMVSELLGSSVDASISSKVLEVVKEDQDVIGAYDLVLHNYGPHTFMGSIHVEVKETMNAGAIDKMTRRITSHVLQDTGIILTAIGIYSSNTDNPVIVDMKQTISTIVLAHKEVRQIHGFYVDLDKKHIQFDVVIGFDCIEKEVKEEIELEMKKRYPEYDFEIIVEHDISNLSH